MFKMVPLDVPVSSKKPSASKYKEHIDKVKYDKIIFPVKLKDIQKLKR